MESTTPPNTLRSILVYVFIGALLLVAVILGVRWAKARSDSYAKASQTPSMQQTAANTKQPASNQPQTNTDKPAATNSAPSTSSTPNSTATPTPTPKPSVAVQPPQIVVNPTPKQMPSTGAEDFLLPIGSLVVLVFASLTYMQSRRRLLRL
jgi:outer membrane biosynthesis protein TonB